MILRIPRTDKGEKFVGKLKFAGFERGLLNVKEYRVLDDQYNLPFYQVTITPKNEWETLGFVDHETKIVYNLKADENLNKYLVDSKCDACGTKRNRKTTYIVKHKVDGTVFQLGTSCINEFLGFGKDFWDLVGVLVKYEKSYLDSDVYREFKRFHHIFNIKEALKYSIILIQNWGYLSKTKQWDGMGIATARLVEGIFLGSDSLKNFKWDDKLVEQKVENVLSYFRNEFKPEDNNDFHKNIAQVIEDTRTHDSITVKELGFISYLPVFYDKILGTLEIQTQKGVSQWVGKEKDKLELELKFVSQNGYTSEFGYVTFYKFYDGDGNCFVWKTGTSKPFEVGNSYKLKFTIKGHTEFADEKQTSILRVKIIKE